MSTRFVRLSSADEIECVLHEDDRTSVLAKSETGAGSRLREARSTVRNVHRELMLSGFRDDHLSAAERKRLGQLALQAVRDAAPKRMLQELLDKIDAASSAGQSKPPVILPEAEEFPWELIQLEPDGPILGERVAFARFDGAPTGQSIQASRLTVIAPRAKPAGLHPPDQPPTSFDAPWGGQYTGISTRFGEPEILDKTGATHDAVLAKLESAQTRVLHFMGHHFDDPTNQGLDFLQLSGGRLSPADVRDLADRLNGPGNVGPRPLRWPWVFLNACATNSTVERPGTASGWGPTFRAAGAGAFIGTYWIINEGVSADAAIAFYEAVAGGSTIGEALRRVREIPSSNPEKFHTTYWAYTLFGDPTRKVNIVGSNTGEGSLPPQ